MTAPAGYGRLPDGTRCTCAKMWSESDGSYWCCMPSKAMPAETRATTNVRCPRCKSPDLLLIEIGTWTSEFVVTGGTLNRKEGNHEPGSVDRLEAKCIRCLKHWKVRGASQITDVVKDPA